MRGGGGEGKSWWEQKWKDTKRQVQRGEGRLAGECMRQRWHRGKGSWGPRPVSSAPVPPCQGSRAGGAPSSHSSGDLSAASQETRILLGDQPCSWPISFPLLQESLDHGCHPLSTAHRQQGLLGSGSLSWGHCWIGAADGTRLNRSYVLLAHQKRKKCCFLSCKDKGMKSQSSLK